MKRNISKMEVEIKKFSDLSSVRDSTEEKRIAVGSITIAIYLNIVVKRLPNLLVHLRCWHRVCAGTRILSVYYWTNSPLSRWLDSRP